MAYVLLESGGLEVAEKYCETIVKQLKTSNVLYPEQGLSMDKKVRVTKVDEDYTRGNDEDIFKYYDYPNMTANSNVGGNLSNHVYLQRLTEYGYTLRDVLNKVFSRDKVKEVYGRYIKIGDYLKDISVNCSREYTYELYANTGGKSSFYKTVGGYTLPRADSSTTYVLRIVKGNKLSVFFSVNLVEAKYFTNSPVDEVSLGYVPKLEVKNVISVDLALPIDKSPELLANLFIKKSIKKMQAYSLSKVTLLGSGALTGVQLQLFTSSGNNKDAQLFNSTKKVEKTFKNVEELHKYFTQEKVSLYVTRKLQLIYYKEPHYKNGNFQCEVGYINLID